MKLNRKWTMVFALVMSLTMATAGTLAYLADTDADVNVMTLGSVHIVQNEQERDSNGTLVPFTPQKPAYPAVGPVEWAATGADVNGTEYKVFTEKLQSVIDKIVTVTSTGKSDAYVRTILAIEAPDYDPNGMIHINVNSTGVTYSDWVNVEINGVKYCCMAATYAEPLAPAATSAPSLMQLFLDSAAGNKEVEDFGDTWEVLVLSQAMQTQGFGNAEAALNEGFGEVTADNVVDWFGGWEQWGKDDIGSPGDKNDTNNPPEYIDSAQEAYDVSWISGNYTLGVDYNTSEADSHYTANREYAIRDDKDVTLNLNGHTINHDGTYQDGKNTGYTYLFTTAYNGKLTINGTGTINSENTEGMCCIVYAQGPSEVVINGGDFNTVRGIPVWAGNNAKVTINGGSFISTGSDDEELIYSSGGVIDIYGGFFHNKLWDDRPVNVADANRGTGFINIYGGTFVNFDPSTGGNDPSNIRVMDGYKVVSETQASGDVWYTVVKE